MWQMYVLYIITNAGVLATRTQTDKNESLSASFLTEHMRVEFTFAAHF